MGTTCLVPECVSSVSVLLYCTHRPLLELCHLQKWIVQVNPRPPLIGQEGRRDSGCERILAAFKNSILYYDPIICQCSGAKAPVQCV